MIAALLDLQESAGMAREAGDAAGADPLGLHDLVDSQPGRGAQGHPGETPGVQFFLVAQDVIHFGHGGEGLRIELGRAAGDDDARQGIALTVLADFLTRLAHRFAGHRAGVDHDGRIETGPTAMGTHHLALIGVQPAAEIDNLERHRG